MNYYPDNTLTTYSTKLAQPLDLDGSWEVGLAEIQYPNSWYNIRKDEAWFTVQKRSEKIAVPIKLKPGYYDIKRLLKVILNKAENIGNKQWLIMLFDEVTHKVKMTLNTNYILSLSPGLQRFLGFSKTNFSGGAHVADHVADLHQGFYSLYVYCPVVEPRMVGDAFVPLLREIAIEGHSGDVITKTYEKIHYIPLQHRRFETLDIYIRDDTGKPVPFEWGKVVVTLCFRRRSLKDL